MNTRRLGKTGYQVSEISFGAWGIGGDWGAVDDRESIAALHAALDLGVNFFDTADVYGDGRSERLVGQLARAAEPPSSRPSQGARRSTPSRLHIRELPPSSSDRARISASSRSIWCSSIARRGIPTTGRRSSTPGPSGQRAVRAYGVSVEKVEEALKAIEFPSVASPDHLQHVPPAPGRAVPPAGRGAQLGIIARVPLASGLLTGKLGTAASPATITGTSIVTARPSTWARPSRASPSRPGSRRSRSCPSCPTARRWPSWPCAGSSSSMASRPRSRERRHRSRRGERRRGRAAAAAAGDA